MDQIHLLAKERNLHFHLNQGIFILNIPQKNGLEFTKELLGKIVNKKSLLLLSGGRTPKELYEELAKEEHIFPGAVGQIDERYGKPFHENSNQKMIKDAGLHRYLEMRDIRFYPILETIRHSEQSERRLQNQPKKDGSWTGQDDDRRKAAKSYDKTLRELFSLYHQAIGILGIGMDGHTAGIPVANEKLKTENPKLYETFDYVTQYNDHDGFYKERITMTFAGLSMLDLHIVLVFGEDKKKALDLMFTDGDEEAVPSRFFRRPEIAMKTIIITDQQI